jgi:SAM-dependent methyltransferase
MSLRSHLVSQFHCPRGSLGQIAAWIMSHRKSNVERSLWTVAQLGIGPDENVLEIGFGPGVALERASQQTCGRVVGIDHSELMCRVASRRNQQAVREGRVEIHCAGIDALPEWPRRFDAILAVNCLMFWPDPVQSLRALRECARPQARIAVTHQPRNPQPTLADVERAESHVSQHLHAAGFAEPRAERLPLEPVPASCVIAHNPH